MSDIKQNKNKSLIPSERIISRIFFIRDKKVMIDHDLAELYGVETKILKRAVNRNIERFPSDFMFQLSKEEYDSLRCQFGALKRGGHAKYLPYVFTQEGVAMLSSVLRSKRAVQVNIQIMRTFIKLREMLLTHMDFKVEIDRIEKKMNKKFINHDQQFKAVFDAIKQLITQEEKSKPKIGFKA